MNENKAIQAILDRFTSNVQGKKADVTKANKRHDGKEGHWLERQMGITPNANNEADIFGFEMKKQTRAKTTFGDWAANYYIFKNPEYNLTRDDGFLPIFGKANEKKGGRYSWSGEPCPKIDNYNGFGQRLIIDDHENILAIYSFSQAGLKQGFNDTRGTMFFEIQRILAEKRPKAFLLENVKQLRGHDKGKTLSLILSILRGENNQSIPQDVPMSDDAKTSLSKKLNYSVDYRVLRAADFGIPQNRERIYIIGFDRDYFGKDCDLSDFFSWPKPSMKKTRVGDILEDLTDISDSEDKFTISDKLWAGHIRRKQAHKKKGNGFGYSLYTPEDAYTNTISARYYKDGSEILIDQRNIGKNPRKLTPRECANLQGFPKKFIVDAVSNGQIYKQFGNSVCMSVIEAVAEQIHHTIYTPSLKQEAKRRACQMELI